VAEIFYQFLKKVLHLNGETALENSEIKENNLELHQSEAKKKHEKALSCKFWEKAILMCNL